MIAIYFFKYKKEIVKLNSEFGNDKTKFNMIKAEPGTVGYSQVQSGTTGCTARRFKDVKYV